MSKKIKITIPNKVKPNLVALFHEYLSRKAKEPIISCRPCDFDDYDDMAAYWDEVFPGWDDAINDDGDVVFPIFGSKSKTRSKKRNDDVYESYWQSEREERWNKKKGKHKHSKSKCAKIIGINVPYSGDEENPSEYDFDDIHLDTDDFEPSSKEIWFYPDYHCKDDRLEFNSLKEFSDYCDSMGYFVDKQVADDISWRYESHCCLSPESEKAGLLEIMTEHSYGEMFYVACDENELGI